MILEKQFDQTLLMVETQTG